MASSISVGVAVVFASDHLKEGQQINLVLSHAQNNSTAMTTSDVFTLEIRQSKHI